MKPSHDKLHFKELKNESGFKSWSKSLEMALDDVWVGIEDVLKQVRAHPERVASRKFEEIIAERDLRAPDVRADDWSFKTISRYLYGVLYNHTDPDLQGVVEQCEDDKDGIEAYRLLASHCDPLNFNTNNTLMEAITKHGRRKVSADSRMAIEEFLTTVREVKRSLGEYEKRVTKLPEAKTTWIP